MKVISPITLDVKKTNIQKKIRAFTGEGGTRELVITLVSGNDTIEVPNTYVVSICGVKPDGTEFANTATVEDGKIIYTLTTQNLTVAGDVDCQVRVTKTGELLYTSKFVIKVEGNLSDEETETSSNEWTELITALDRVNALSVIFTGEGAPSTDPEEYPDIQESNFYYDETNGRYYYATNVSTTITWKRIYNKDEVDALLADKQDELTAGDGIDLTNDTVSVDLKSSGSHLDFSSGKLGVDIVTLGVSGLRQELANTMHTSSYPPLTSKTYVDNEFDKRVVESSSLPPEESASDAYAVGTIWIHQAAPYHSYLLVKKTFSASYYRYAWRDLSNLISFDNFDIAFDDKMGDSISDGLDYDEETGLSVWLDSNSLLSFTSEGALKLTGDTIANDSTFKTTLGSYVYTETEVDNLLAAKQALLTAGNGIDLTSNTLSIDISSGSIMDFYNGKLRLLGSQVADDSGFQSTMPYVNAIRQGLLTTYGDYNFQPKLTAGTNITIDSNNVISATGGSGGSYTAGNGIDITNNTISAKLYSSSDNAISNSSSGLIVSKSVLGYDQTIREKLVDTSVSNPLQPKLTAGTNITIDSNNVISASGGGLSYTFTDGLAESSGTVGIDLKSGTELQITNGELDIDLSDYATTTDLSSKQDTIDSTHKLDADLVDDSTSTNKFVSANEKQTWNDKISVPTSAQADSGKFLRVNASGNAEWQTVPQAESNSF